MKSLAERQADKITETHIKANALCLESLIKEIKQEKYKTAAQVVSAININLDVIKKLGRESLGE